MNKFIGFYMNKNLIKKYAKDIEFFRVDKQLYCHHSCFKEYVPDIVGLDRGNLVIEHEGDFLVLSVLDHKKIGSLAKELKLKRYLRTKFVLGKDYRVLTSETIEALNSTMIKYTMLGSESDGFRSNFANLFWEAETLSL